MVAVADIVLLVLMVMVEFQPKVAQEYICLVWVEIFVAAHKVSESKSK